MVKPDSFYTRFDEEQTVVRKCNRKKRYELRVVNCGKLSKAHSFRFLLGFLCLGARMLLSSGCRESTSCLRVLGTASGEIQKVLPALTVS